MTEREAGELLLAFPGRWENLQAKRESILEAYHSISAYDGPRIQTSGHSDPTGKRAERLAGIKEQDVLLQAVRNWLAIGLIDTKDRIILLDLWRGVSVQTIIRRRNCWDIGLRWQRMAQRLIRFVGPACGEHGAAYATSLQNGRRG